jgi:hypothetical protein
VVDPADMAAHVAILADARARRRAAAQAARAWPARTGP